MTPKQREALTAIDEMTVDGVGPTFDDLKERLCLSSRGNVHRLVHALIDRGYLAYTPGRARSLRLTMRSRLDGLSTDELLTLRSEIEARLAA